ncbi:ribonuclease III [Phormidesmis priestleyi]
MTLQYPRRQQQLQSLLQRLGVPEKAPIRWELLDLALTHSTASAEANYEQLEFVGDAVVKLAAAEFLLETYPDLKVGEFTAMRSVLVSDRILALIADEYGFDRYLLVSASAMTDRAGKESRLADSLEAVLAALYLSTHTLQLVRPWLDRHFHPLSAEILADPARQNYKAALQSWTQGHQKTLPEYRTQESGQTHNDPERFISEVWLQGKCLGQGMGRSRKAAEQAAAQVAFLSLSAEAESV